MARKKKVTNRLQQIGETRTRGSRPAPPSMPGRPSESQLVEIGLFISATPVGMLILLVLAVFFGLRAIENHLETTAEDGLVARGVTDVDVEATGVDVQLRGTVATEQQLSTVPQFVAQIEGVGEVQADLVWLPPVELDDPVIVAAPITISWANRQATIEGEVSDEANRTAFVDALDELFPNGVNADGLAIKEGAPSERDWLSKILQLLQIAAGSLSEGEIFISADQRIVQMSGEYESRQERRDARDAIEDVVAETTFAFVSSLSIPEAPTFTQEEVVELQENLDDLIEGKVVEFELNSDVLTPVGAALLDEILAALEMFPNVPIEIGDTTVHFLVSHPTPPVFDGMVAANGQIYISTVDGKGKRPPGA